MNRTVVDAISPDMIALALPRATDAERAQALTVAQAILVEMDPSLSPTDLAAMRAGLSDDPIIDLGMAVTHVVRAIADIEGIAALEIVAGQRAVMDAVLGHLRFEAADVLGRVLVSHSLSDALTAHPRAFAIAANRIRCAESAIREMLLRVAADRPMLSDIAPDFDPDSAIAGLHLGAGDTHADGRAVAIIAFTDGTHIVYKPRSLACDVGFAHLIRWMNERLGTGLHAARTIDRGTYGYAEFIRTSEHSQQPEADCEAIGRLLALLHALRACDMHYENIILSERGPIVVDAETLLTPIVDAASDYAAGSASRAAAVRIADSVLGIGLLPTLIGDPAAARGFDVGFLGYRAGQRSPYRAVTVSPGVGTSLQFGTASTAAPTRALDDLPTHRQRDGVRRGFDRLARAIAADSDSFLRAVGRYLSRTTVRVVPAPTVTYRQLLTMSYHPDALADPHLRAAVLARVVLRDGRPGSGELSVAEARQLARGDIPVFTCAVEDSVLVTHVAGERLAIPFGGRSPLHHVREYVPRMNEDRGRQLRFIDLAFVSSLDKDDDRTTPGEVAHKDPLDSTRHRLARLADEMIRGTTSRFPATWIDPSVTVPDQSQWRPGSLGYDVYGGAPGIALVLAAGSVVFGDEGFAESAAAVLRPLSDQLTRGALGGVDPAAGGLTGAGSTVYSLALASRYLGADRLPVDREAMLSLLVRAAEDPRQSWDFVGGIAGALAAAVAVADEERAGSAIERLSERALRAIDDVAWDQAYTGYAHGAAGAAIVLLRASTVCNDERLRRRGVEMLDRVRETIRGGRVPRTFVAEDRQESVAWCHGATGVMLALLQAREVDRALADESEVQSLAQHVCERGFGNNPTLCHGDAGSLDVLTSVVGQLPTLSIKGTPLIDQMASLTALVSRSAENARRQRRNRYGFVNSVMVGAAGTAWAVMRAGHPSIMPSLLGLADLPPKRAVEHKKKKAG
ncbi:type 2 lanthipeptide synthetase LanM [Microbacterium sp. ZW T5_56]|uniref:type 2 lanthipeptide synthetase LanM n=1 Tax=Microbacterium sp. ZW T5_56 TaxID=3378081 RepID=UPI003851AC77